MKTHYETLGITPDASADQIKRAYREKAKRSHPDKGGKQSDFEPVVKAYEVLSDPERRLLYDTTGQDRRTPIEMAVQQLLMQLFNQALAAPDDIPIVKTVTEKLNTGQANLRAAIKDLKARQTKLEAKRETITSKGPTNIAHMIIDGELKNIAGQISEFEHQIAVAKAALAELKSYSENWEHPAVKQQQEQQYFVIQGLRF